MLDNKIMLGVIGLTITIIIGLIIFRLRHKARTRPYFIKGPIAANPEEPVVIQNKDILRSKVGMEFSFSFWINIEDLNYKYNIPKHIFHIGDKDAKQVCPSVWIYPRTNNLMIRMNTIKNSANNMNPIDNKKLISKIQPCDIENIPIQRWCHVGITLSNKTIDIFINGKLSRSCTLKDVPAFNNGDLYINSFGGYKGLISDFLYCSEAISANDMYKLYIGGHNAFIIYNYFNFVVPKLKIKSNLCKEINNSEE